MKNKNIGLSVFCQLVFMASLVFCSKNVSAYSIQITTNDNIVADVSPEGTGVSIHRESIRVVSNCRNGYNLSIATSESSNLYIDGDNSNPGSFTAVDGTSALNSNNNTNKWGYTLTGSPSGNTVFSPLSTTAAPLKTSTQTASPSRDINDNFYIHYGLKADYSLTPGSYQMANDGVIIYYLTMDTTCTQYTVAYNANGGTGTMASQTLQEGESANLTAKAFTAPTGASYTDANNNTINGDANKLWAFWGWNTAADGTGDWYKDKEAITDLGNSGDTVTLYAQWKQATLADMTAGTQVGTEKVIDHNLMQDMLPEACYNSPITTAANAPAATLLDYRGKVTTGDNPESPEQYNVSKLADGLCWMTTNLNLGRSGTDGPNGDGTITLTSQDTDLAKDTTFTLPAGDTTTYTGTTNYARIRLTNTSGTNANGVYYTWAAAVANTTSISTNPTTSICPKGWDLPYYTQYTNLATKSSYSSSNPTTAAPSSFLTNGGFTNGASFYQTSYSYYWTNGSYNTTRGHGVRINSTSITNSSNTGTTYGGNKYYRKNLRCIASRGTVTINYDGNGTNEYPVTGTTASQNNVEINVGVNAQTNGFTREGWSFKNWNTAADGSGTSISAGATLTTLSELKPGGTITLYAQWTPQYTITYINNCKFTPASTNANCTQTVSDEVKTQKINLNASGNGSGSLASYNHWTLASGWKIDSWNTSPYGTGTRYETYSTYSVTGQGAGSGITLYAQWAPTYSIQYDGNGASNSGGMGTTDGNGVKSIKQTNVSENNSVTLLPSNFKRSGHGFAGWSTDPDAWAHFIDNDITNDSRIYGPQETIEALPYPNNGTNVVTMYAVWVPAETSGGNPVYLQNFGSTECANLTSATFDSSTGNIYPGSVIALTDKRDNQVYAVAKLTDGNCWMVENLRLEHEGTVGNNINDPTITNESLSQGYDKTAGVYGNFKGLANPESETFDNEEVLANSMYKTDGSGDVFDSTLGTLEDIGTSNVPAYRFPRYNHINTDSTTMIDGTTYTESYNNSSSPSTSGSYTSSSIYSYGNYYSWAAAKANTRALTTAESNNALTSICPSGWVLPVGSATAAKSFGTLSVSLGGPANGAQAIANTTPTGTVMSNRFRSFPNNILTGGSYQYDSAVGRGDGGKYWTRTSGGTTSSGAYGFSFFKPYVYPNTVNLSKYWGLAVRCLVQ